MTVRRNTAGMCAFSSFRVTLASVVVAAMAMLVWSPSTLEAAGDRQMIPPGNGGEPGAVCVDAGPDNRVDSTVVLDDVLKVELGVEWIEAGPNGICDSGAVLGDVLRIPTGNGAANRAVILTGGDGICNDATVSGGDDVRVIAIGQGRPFMVTIRVGGDGTLETAPSGDDIATQVICAGDAVLDSIPDPADQRGEHFFDPLCLNLCTGIASCIIPGNDGTLQTTPDPGDVLEWFISSGPDGVANTAARPTDIQFVPVLSGFISTAPGETCIDSGANGVAESSICGNGILDDDENGSTVFGPACDDGNTVAGDGCGHTCLVESGWDCAGQPSVCTPICGDHLVRGSEPCDDGNASNRDNCLNTCQLPSCGDGFLHDQGTGSFEQCDDGGTINGDGCTATCQDEFCGDGVVNNNGSEECDDGNTNDHDACPTNCQNAKCGDRFVHTGSEQCDDGNLTSGDCCSATCTIETDGNSCNDGSLCTLNDSCSSGVCQGTTSCGNGVVQGICDEQCDDGGVIPGDGCNATCQDEFCGDGIANDSGSEECDDGNPSNNDGCVQGCKDAKCGDGFKHTSVEECDDHNVISGDGCSSTCVKETRVHCGNGPPSDPGEECDDGNNSNRDDCTNICEFAVCGDGYVHDKGTGTEQCDDDNAAPGDGCSPTCTLECGNGVFDGACSEGSVGAACSTNADCDTVPGNGVCIGEQCDPGQSCNGGSNSGAPCATASVCPGGRCAPLFCVPGPQACSAVCLISRCGNGAVECSEQCDLGSANGVVGSGCTAECQRNLVGPEPPGLKECLSAWTLDSAPQDLRFREQVCTDGAPCDFDGVPNNGSCTFNVGVCLNRSTSPAGCTGGMQAFDLQRLKFRGICSLGLVGHKCVKNRHHDDCETATGAHDGFCLSREAEAAESITHAVSSLVATPTIATKVPDRCRVGLKGKVCSIPDDNECDRVFGAGDGRCDIGAGVEFYPPLNRGDQQTECTPSFDVVVDAGKKLKLSSHVRRTTGPSDNDKLMLVCKP